MTRRIRTLIVGGVMLAVLIALTFTLPVPYVILSPGETFNTLGNVPGKNTPIIAVTGKTTNATSGTLILTTVNETTEQVTVIQALAGWIEHDNIVVPHDSVVPPGTSQEQENKQATQDFVGSQDSASAAAFCELGYPHGVAIQGFSAGSKATTALKVGDRIISVNGLPANTLATLTAVLQNTTVGSDASVVVDRGTTGSVTVSVPLVAPPAGGKGGRMGVTVEEGCIAPFQVDLALADQIGGPSGGLMFALGIIDKVGSRDLTKGTKIAGTGTIDASGKVGPIGGIALKMIGARRAGATVFLAPDTNCGDVRGNIPKGLNVVKVDTLHNAISDLLDLQSGKAVPHC